MIKRKIPKNIILGTILLSSILNNVNSYSASFPESVEENIISKFKDINKNKFNDVKKDELLNAFKNKVSNSNKKEKFIYNKEDIKKYESKLKDERISSSKNKKSPKVVAGKVLPVTLADGEFISTSLKDNPEGYETIRVTTTGSKKLNYTDYSRLKESGIPKIDLSNAKSDSITRSAFKNAYHLTEFKFPQGITKIEDYAFYDCANLIGDLIIPDTVTTIGKEAFRYCEGFTSLKLGNSLKTIDMGAFSSCTGFTGNLIIPESVTSLGLSAFECCTGFTGNIDISHVSTVDAYVFSGCTGITSFNLKENYRYIAEGLFYGCTGLTGYYIVPDYITSMDYAFDKTNLKVIFILDETDIDSDYKKSLITSTSPENTFIDMPYELYNETWIKNSKYRLTVNVDSTYGKFKNNEGILSYLEINAPYEESNISITKNGKKYPLPKINDNKYLFEEEGNYTINVTNDLGTYYNISFKNNPVIKSPEIKYLNSKVSIKDNGSIKVMNKKINESFDNISDINDSVMNFESDDEGVTWIVEDGVLKSTGLGNGLLITGRFLIESDYEDTIKVRVKSTTMTTAHEDYGIIAVATTDSDGEIIDGVIDDGTGDTVGYFSDYVELELAINRGYNELIFMAQDVNILFTGTPGQFMIDFVEAPATVIEYLSSEVVEYRVNNGEWLIYTGEINLDGYKGGIKFEARAKSGSNISSIVSKNIYIEIPEEEIAEEIERIEELAQSSQLDFDNLSNVRDMINNMPESTLKDLYQDRLNALIPNDISSIDKKNISSSVDIYLKAKEYLKVSVDTSYITFEDFDGVDDMIKENAINLTVESSSPYNINTSLETEIQNENGTNILDKSILGVKSNDSDTYETFTGIQTPITLLDNQESGRVNTHSIDLKLNKGVNYKVDVYKTVLKFEINQK